ncbi:MAG: DUF305 domain-containing protein [Acidimicrobiales bacterium]|jgi:uncharacterized protein (DUF305 family)|nr:DUF305 domain-containing protein [Acidimicrobiales bacterium]
MEGPGLAESLTPRSTGQWILAVVALVFLAGAVGYAIRAFAEPSPNELSTVDEGFLIDMVDHHDQAVEMSIIATDRASDPQVRRLAQEVIISQRWELGVMESVLGRGGLTRRTDPEQLAMGWMGMAPMPAAEMPGLATEEQLEELRGASPEQVNDLFLELMIAHHEAGVEMAEFAAADGSNAYVRQFASDVGFNQRDEIDEYRRVQARLAAAAQAPAA